jgi:hypothetical protein
VTNNVELSVVEQATKPIILDDEGVQVIRVGILKPPK